MKETFKNRIRIYKGLFKKAEDILPDYSLVPEWEASIIFASRGFIRNCPFCAVKVLEPKFSPKKSIKHLIYPVNNKQIYNQNIKIYPFFDLFDL